MKSPIRLDMAEDAPQKRSWLSDAVLPTVLTLFILFCLAQLGLSFWNSNDALTQENNTDQYAAISAFAN